MSKINKKAVLYTAVFLLGGCLNEQNIASEIKNEADNPAKILPPQTCNIPVDAFNHLPTDVLDGTDVVNIRNFKPAAISGAHFHAEIGGASIEIDGQLLDTQHKIQRTYKEPDVETLTTTYNNLCVKSGRLYGESIRGIFTEKGILWLELTSGNEFISPDLWIFLETN